MSRFKGLLCVICLVMISCDSSSDKVYNDKGELIKESIYKGDTLVVKEYHDNGSVKSQLCYLDNNLMGKGREFYSDGTLKTEITRDNKGLIQGDYLGYFENGRIRFKIHYLNGKKGGESIYYFANGQIKARKNYLRDVLHGNEIVHSEDGKKVSEGEYRNGVKEGMWKYYVNGELVSYEKYRAGELIKIGVSKEKYKEKLDSMALSSS